MYHIFIHSFVDGHLVFTCISQMTNNVKRLLISLFFIPLSSLSVCLNILHVFNWVVSLFLSYKYSLYWVKVLYKIYILHFFPQSLSFLFIFLTVSLKSKVLLCFVFYFDMVHFINIFLFWFFLNFSVLANNFLCNTQRFFFYIFLWNMFQVKVAPDIFFSFSFSTYSLTS